MLRYHLKDLTWQQFEALCQTLLQAKYGLAIELWGGSGDRGRDAYCPFDIPFVDGVLSKGPFIFQVKHVTAADSEKALQSAVNAECREIQRRIDSKEWHDLQHYVLITNVEVSDDLKKAVEKPLKALLPNITISSRWGEDVCSLLEQFPALKLQYPQLLDIRDIDNLFSGIVTEVMYADTRSRSTTLLNKARELRKVFEPTRAFGKALHTLAEHHLVVLTGAPEMGKTAIARMIAWGMAEAGWNTIACVNPTEFLALRKLIRGRTLFVADDAFGTTEYEPAKAIRWVEELDNIIDQLDDEHLLIWTARTTPLRLALKAGHLDYALRKFPAPADVEVNASELTRQEKAYMFFQHCRRANFDESVKKIIRKYAEDVVQDKYFTPERIRRLVVEQLTDELPTIIAGTFEKADILRLVKHGIDRATDEMEQSFQQLDGELQSILIAMLDTGSTGISTSDLESACLRLFDKRDLVMRISDLEGHFVQNGKAGGKSHGTETYDWLHPSWRDVVIDWIAGRDALRERFLCRCGAKGVALAVSQGGGADGTRNLPFLRSEHDWTQLTGHLPKVVDESSSGDLDILFAGFTDLAKRAETDESFKYADQVQSITLQLLQSCRARWDTRAEHLEARMLSSYYELSELIGEVEPSPKLIATWEDVVTLFEKIRRADYVQEVTGKDLDDCFWILALLKDNEPRFLKVIAFPESYLDPLRSLLKLLGDYDYDGIDRNRESYRSEEGYIDDLKYTVSRIGGITTSLKSECDVAIQKLSDRETKLKSDYDDLDDDEVKQASILVPTVPASSPQPEAAFSVEDLFATL